MLEINLLDLFSMAMQYFFPFVRISTVFFVMPLVGSKMVPPRIRLAFSLLVTAIIAPLVDSPAISDFQFIQIILIVLVEVLLGIIIGFSLQIVFHVFAIAGQMMAMKIGLGFAMMNDPSNGVQTTIISQFFLMLAMLMFFGIDGHLTLVTFLAESFDYISIGDFSNLGNHFFDITHLGGWMIAAALSISLPVAISVLLVNIAFGFMSRAAPQLNIFAIGFPFTLLAGLLMIWLLMLDFSPLFIRTMTFGFEFIRTLFLSN